MKIIIPMAGTGQRFVDAGYKDPKPLIKVDGKCIVDYVLDMFDRERDEFVFICNKDHLITTDMVDHLTQAVKRSRIIGIAPHKVGPVFTVLKAIEFIEDEEPVIIAYCDNPVKWNYPKFLQLMANMSIDGGIVSHKGFHPHTLGNTMFAYSRTNSHGWVSEIKEKACYTDNRFNEHASSGIYYFKKGEYVKKYFKEVMDKNVNYNGEFYVTLVFNLLIRDGLRVWSYLNDEVFAFGTPDMVKNYEAWQSLLKGEQIKNEEDLINCYNYWKNVKDRTQGKHPRE